MKKRVSFIFATWFGVGYFPVASGTAGSLAALPPAFLAIHLGGWAALIALAAIVYIVGTFASNGVLKYSEHDPSFIVIDEVAGQLITFIPVAGLLATRGIGGWWIYAAGFLLFRLFDITKPWPAGYLDRRVLNANGVMLDDVAAGLYAAAVLKGITLL